MSRISSMAKLDKGLVVKGTGYASPVQSASTAAAVSSTVTRRKSVSNPLRRTGSLGNVATNGTAKNSCKSRVPFLPAGASRSHCGPKSCTNVRSLGQIPSTSSQQSIICKCQHPADISFLENIYVQNLQTQIEVLEMENNYLRAAELIDTKKQGVQPKSILVRSEHRSYPPAKEDHIPANTANGDGMFKEYDSNGTDQQPGYHGPHRYYNHRSTSSTVWSKLDSAGFGDGRQEENQDHRVQEGYVAARKRVEFADEMDEEIRAPSQKAGPDTSTAKQNERTKNNNGIFERSPLSKIHPAFKDQSTQERFQDEDLFLKLEQAFQNEIKLEESLKAQTAENRKLRSERDLIYAQLRSCEGKLNRQHRSLMEDNVELQRRLDELTPLLAEREAKLLRTEEEMERSDARLKHAETLAASLQAKLEEQKREDTLFSELDSDRRAELQILREKLRKRDADLHDANQREIAATNELKSIRQNLYERERAESQERAMCQRITEENRSLSDANAQLEQKAEKLERLVQKQEKEILSQKHNANAERQLHESQRIENNLRTELRRLNEELAREREASNALKYKQREWAASEENYRDARHRMMNELEALQALSNSLTSENKGLREERIAVDERIQILQDKVFAKEMDVKDLTERLEEFKHKYTEAINRLSTEIARQNETSEELEEIVKRVHELSNSIPRRIGSPPPFSPTSVDPGPATFQPLRQNSGGKSAGDAIGVGFLKDSPTNSTRRDFAGENYVSESGLKEYGKSKTQVLSHETGRRDSDKAESDEYTRPKMKLSQLKQRRDQMEATAPHSSTSPPSHSETGSMVMIGMRRSLSRSRRTESHTDHSDDQNSELSNRQRKSSKTRRPTRQSSLGPQSETNDPHQQSHNSSEPRRPRPMRSFELGSATRNVSNDEISSSNTSAPHIDLHPFANDAEGGELSAQSTITTPSVSVPSQGKEDDSLSWRYRKKIS